MKFFGVSEDKIRNYIQDGDSIVKIKDSETIVIYRKDSINNWGSRLFK